jgi:hypothetical protein
MTEKKLSYRTEYEKRYPVEPSKVHPKKKDLIRFVSKL